MTPRNSSASYGVRTFATLLICRYRVNLGRTASSSAYRQMSGDTRFPKFGCGIGSSMHQVSSISSGDLNERPDCKMEQKDAALNVQPSDPAPPRPNIFSWVKWVLGSILPLMFSFWKQNWDSMLKLEGKVEEVTKEVEEVAEVVEKVASTTEKISAEVAEKLDNGELKQVALMVEHASTIIANDARITEEFIHKVADLKQDITDLENMVEPVIDKTKK